MDLSENVVADESVSFWDFVEFQPKKDVKPPPGLFDDVCSRAMSSSDL